MAYLGNQQVEIITEYPHTLLIKDARGCLRTVARRAIRTKKDSSTTYEAVDFKPPEPPDVVADKKLTAAGRLSLRGPYGGHVLGGNKKGSIKKPGRDEDEPEADEQLVGDALDDSFE